MKTGRVPENIWKRSVLKQIGHRRCEVIVGAGVGEDSCVLQTGEEQVMLFSVNSSTIVEKNNGMQAVHTVANALAASGAEPVAVVANILLPTKKREKYLRELIEQMEQTCCQLNMEFLGEHTEVSEAVNRPIITINGIGKTERNQVIPTGGLKPGDELVMTKWAGMQGTAILAMEQQKKLLETLPQELIDIGADFMNDLSVVKEAEVAKAAGASAMHMVAEGGIFGALWEMGEASKVGITADLMKIPIRQETIEISEVFGLNPYQMLSGGALLIGCRNGGLMVEQLGKAGIVAKVIGRATDTNDRIVVNGEETRFIEPAGSDEIYKVI